jgi:hypothetical protein
LIANVILDVPASGDMIIALVLKKLGINIQSAIQEGMMMKATLTNIDLQTSQ